MKLIDGYIIKSVFKSTLVVALFLLALMSFILFVGEFSDIGKNDYGIWQALFNVFLQLPGQLIAFFPIIALIGTLMGLSQLASHQELMVIRASGYSVSKIIIQVFKVFFLLLFLVILLSETLIPNLSEYARTYKGHKISGGKAISVGNGAWFRQDNRFIFVNKAATDKHLLGIYQYDFNAKNVLKAALSAKSASYENGAWQLKDVALSHFKKHQVLTEKLKTMPWQIDPPIYLMRMKKNTLDEQSSLALYRLIQVKKAHHLSTNIEDLIFWRRMMLPVTTSIMLLLAIPFVFGHLRQSTMGAKLLAGIAIGFGFYMLNDLMVPLSMLYQLPVLITALAPALLFLLLALYLIQRNRV